MLCMPCSIMPAYRHAAKNNLNNISRSWLSSSCQLPTANNTPKYICTLILYIVY